MIKKSSIALVCTCSTMAFGQQGAWEQWFHWGNHPLGADATIAINLVHLRDGKVLSLWGVANPDARLWTPPAVGSPPGPTDFQAVPSLADVLFCGGHSALADGRILHVGGVYVRYTTIFAPVSHLWNIPAWPPLMTHARWYPTCTTLPDGRALVTSGWRCQDNCTYCPPCNGQDPWVRDPELYDPAAAPNGTWTVLSNLNRQQPLYPWMFVLPNGMLVDAGPGESRLLDISNPNPLMWSWGATIPDPAWPVPPPPAPGYGGSAVMYEPGKIMKCGGQDPAVASTYVIDLSNFDPTSPPRWLVAGDDGDVGMNKARRNLNLVMLPDGKVLAVGGNRVGTSQSNPNAEVVFEAEIFDPAAGTWTLQPSSQVGSEFQRWYHSTAMLLRDGRVVSAGGDGSRTGQIFKPPYITSGAPRTTITQAPTYMQYGMPYVVHYELNGGPEVTKVCLIRLAATTHAFDQDQRYVPLENYLGSQVGLLGVEAPLNANIAPPGYYMLFILTEYAKNKFAPCELAAYVQVGP